MLKILESTKSSIRPKKDRVEVSGNSKAERNGSKLNEVRLIIVRLMVVRLKTMRLEKKFKNCLSPKISPNLKDDKIGLFYPQS